MRTSLWNQNTTFLIFSIIFSIFLHIFLSVNFSFLFKIFSYNHKRIFLFTFTHLWTALYNGVCTSYYWSHQSIPCFFQILNYVGWGQNSLLLLYPLIPIWEVRMLIEMGESRCEWEFNASVSKDICEQVMCICMYKNLTESIVAGDMESEDVCRKQNK